MKILIIDDDIQVNKLINIILADEGYEVLQAYNGVEGLNILNNSPGIDLIITDIIMPEKEGIEVIRDVKKNYPKLKIIAISGGGRISAHNYLNLAKSLGADHILEKPFSKNDLITIIQQLKMS